MNIEEAVRHCRQHPLYLENVFVLIRSPLWSRFLSFSLTYPYELLLTMRRLKQIRQQDEFNLFMVLLDDTKEEQALEIHEVKICH